jgi:Effector Associated Constant Component 1
LTVVDDDPGEVDRLSRQLRTELLDLDIESVDLIEDADVPENAKSNAGAVTTIVVSLAGSPVLVQLGLALRSWVTRSQHRKIVVRDGDRSLELTGTTAEDNQKVIERFFSLDDEGRKSIPPQG